ncbi:unnamed protein product, partial [Porites evermanni]
LSHRKTVYTTVGRSERRWSSDPLRGKRRPGSKRHPRPKTTYIDSTNFDPESPYRPQAVDADSTYFDPESSYRPQALDGVKPTKSSTSSCPTEIPPHVVEKMKTKSYHFIGVDAFLSK